MKKLCILAIIMLGLALLPIWPYGYYQLLRLAVFGVSVFCAAKAAQAKKQEWVWVFAGVALIFNPIFPIYFPKEVWSAIDIVTLVIIGIWLKKNG